MEDLISTKTAAALRLAFPWLRRAWKNQVYVYLLAMSFFILISEVMKLALFYLICGRLNNVWVERAWEACLEILIVVCGRKSGELGSGRAGVKRMETSSRAPDNPSGFLAGLGYHGVDLVKG